MAYENAAQFDRALKRAIREAGGDPGSLYRQALRDRFLCRVFKGGEEDLVLKGGSGALARIAGARETRDVDFGYVGSEDADAVVRDLVSRASLDLGDFCRFELTRREETMDDNGYSRLIKLRFASYVGAEEKDPVLIDLSLDCAPTGVPTRMGPASRVVLDGVETSPYLLYPLEDQLADKLCAIMERQQGGHESSRMKDLVDVVVYARTQEVSAALLSLAIRSECARRKMDVPTAFAAPRFWENGFSRYASSHGLDMSFEEASLIASELFDHVLTGEITGTWDCGSCSWGN